MSVTGQAALRGIDLLLKTQYPNGGWPQYVAGRDRIVVADPKAPALWARFYDLETGRPFFSSRDGVKRYSLAEISHERRNGYAWYGAWAETLLAKEYPAWRAKWVR